MLRALRGPRFRRFMIYGSKHDGKSANPEQGDARIGAGLCPRDRTEKSLRRAAYRAIREEWYGARESDLKLLAMEVSELLDAIEGGEGWSGGRIGRGRPRARVPRILRSPRGGRTGRSPIISDGGGPGIRAGRVSRTPRNWGAEEGKPTLDSQARIGSNSLLFLTNFAAKEMTTIRE